MATHAMNDVEGLELLSGTLASYAVMTSNAASAAALLKADPQRELSPRFINALRSVKQWLEQMVDTRQQEALEELFTPHRRPSSEPDRVFAQLTSNDDSSKKGEDRAHEFRTRAEELLRDVTDLIAEPSAPVAERVEQALGIISEAETEEVHRLQARMGESEMMVPSYLSI